MEDRFIEESVRLRLILSGMTELEEHGLADFSLRRAALGAQVSCAAPYRHFKDKDEYIREIINYVASMWELLSREIEAVHIQNCAKLVVELCMAKLRFFVANKKFRSVIALTSGGIFGASIPRAIENYCKQNGLSEEERELKEYTARIIISGSLMLIDSSHIEKIMSLARKKLEGEFT